MSNPLHGSHANGFVDRRRAEPNTELLSPATQIVGDTDAYLGNAPNDIGRRIADDQLELFVVCHPAEAMVQQFAQLAPDFIALHDLGTQTSQRLLAAVAGAASVKLQKLVIRRQGYGLALATLQFIELPLQPGHVLRIYTTQVDSDTATRHQLAQVLLAHSRLGVIMVGELPAHSLTAALQPLREAIGAGTWPNRQLLMVPLASTPSLPALAAELAGRSGVVVRTTPQVSRPSDAWSYISGAWNRLNGKGAEAPPARPATPIVAAAPPPATPKALPEQPVMHYAATQPMELSPTASSAPARGANAEWADYVQRCGTIKGVTQCCVFDIEQQRALAYSGAQRLAERMAAKGAMLHAVMLDTAQVLGLPSGQPDAAVTLQDHYLLVRPMPGQPQIAVHLVLDRHHGNIGLARAELHKIDQALLGA
jgi:hypothetical protein